ncbi:hypothetical protein NQ314_010799 [Rhamnusium bicolor]|uniref:Uncharacterized protein n=1 Tax=Rhamnusium bicolor TaxID=1586634 RepID=A0AAV8XNW2_9CUCU|nr:hypothetical protein NQ314_010799 [Rhamnusium bicolor]
MLSREDLILVSALILVLFTVVTHFFEKSVDYVSGLEQWEYKTKYVRFIFEEYINTSFETSFLFQCVFHSYCPMDRINRYCFIVATKLCH